MLLTDEAHTTTRIDPELLIEEARQRQRRRQRRRMLVLVATGMLVVLGIGVAQIVHGESAAWVQKPPVVAPVVPRRPGVVYEKVETVIRTPHVPTIRRTGEIWFSTAAPWAYRELLTIPGKPPFEVGAELRRESRFGPEQLVYLYDARADTIYQTGANLAPSHQPSLRTSLRSSFRKFLSQPNVVLLGTRVLAGHKVYVARAYGSTSFGQRTGTIYVDTTTYQPLMSVSVSPDLRSTIRILIYKTLPATAANLKLTSLARSHPGARTRPAPPSIDALYGKASRIGTFGGTDLGPFAAPPP